MKLVEALVQVFKKQKLKVERMRQALAAYWEAPEAEQRSAGEKERKLEEDLRIEQQALDSLMERIRASTMMVGPVVQRYQFIGKPRPAAPDAYLREPIILRLAQGVLAAGMISTVLGFVLKRSEGQTDPVRVWLRSIRRELTRPVGRTEVFVFGTVVLVGVTLAVLAALAQPRIYQASVTVAVSESAKDYGWGELSVFDLSGWLPIITQQVAMQFTRRYNAEPLLGIKMTDREADWLVVEPKIRNHLKAVVRPAANTLEVSYWHSDLKVARDVAETFGRAYEEFPLSRERQNSEAMRRRTAKITSRNVGPERPPVRVVASAGANDYLRAPIVMGICRGGLVAVGCGVLMVFVGRLISLVVCAGVRR